LFSAGTTTSLFVRTGWVDGAFDGVEEESDFVLSAAAAVTGGWLVGRLDIVFTNPCRSWAAPAVTKTKLINNAQNDRYEIFFKFFKTYTPNFFFSRCDRGD
jgi:hypothetical protein